MYLYGESVKVVEHDVIGFRQEGGVTLQRRGARDRGGQGERTGSYNNNTSRQEEKWRRHSQIYLCPC